MVKKSLFLSALILAFLIYSGAVSIKEKNPYSSLIPSNETKMMRGYVSSNPIKTSYPKDTYKIIFSPLYVYSETSISSARGDVTLYIPSVMIESFYPGKLYTAAQAFESSLFVENGAELFLSVEEFKSTGEGKKFIVKKGNNRGWKGKWLMKKIFHFRALCRLQFKRLMYAWGKAGGLLLALLSGSREYTEKSVTDAFKNSGLSHILALSGMHLGLFGNLARFFGRKASGRNFGDAIQLMAITFFVWFAGISPSLFRAFIAAFLLYLNSLLRMNRPDKLSLISVCFIIHVVVFSNHIFDSGFLLSYSSLTGIIIFSKMFKIVYSYFIPYKIRMSLADSTSAQIATAPISFKLFGKIAPVGIIATLFISPLVVFFLYAGLFGVIICLLLPFLSQPFSAIMNLLYLFIKKLVFFFSFYKE